MLFPEVHPNDIVNPALRKAALEAIDQDQRIAVWHGRDLFTGEDVEVLINLDTKKGGMSLDKKAFAATISEKGKLIVLHFENAARGIVEVDIQAETLAMNRERTGLEVFNDGQTAHLRLFDKLSGEDILDLHGDQVHELVDDKTLDPKDYQGSAFKYADSVGLI